MLQTIAANTIIPKGLTKCPYFGNDGKDTLRAYLDIMYLFDKGKNKLNHFGN